MQTDVHVKLLIADDDSDVLAAYAVFFGSHYLVQIASDGRHALSIYDAWRPVAVILDIQMPFLDGHAVARAIRTLGYAPAPLLIAITSLSSVSDKKRSLKAGFDHHFVKPAHLPTVHAAILARLRP